MYQNLILVKTLKMNRNYSIARDKGQNRPDESNQLQMNQDDSPTIGHCRNV